MTNETTKTVFENVSLDIIEVAEGWNPRKDFGDIEGLCNQMLAEDQMGNPVGIELPLTVRRNGDKLILINGERRYRAATMAHARGATFLIPVMIRPEASSEDQIIDDMYTAHITNDGKALEFGEQAESFLKLKEAGQTASAIAKRLGRDTAYVTARINFAMKATPEVKEMVAKKEVPPTVAAAIVQKTAKAKGDVTEAVKVEAKKVVKTKADGSKPATVTRKLTATDKIEQPFKRLSFDQCIKQIQLAKDAGDDDVARGIRIALGMEKGYSSLAAKLDAPKAAKKAAPKKDDGKTVAKISIDTKKKSAPVTTVLDAGEKPKDTVKSKAVKKVAAAAAGKVVKAKKTKRSK